MTWRQLILDALADHPCVRLVYANEPVERLHDIRARFEQAPG